MQVDVGCSGALVRSKEPAQNAHMCKVFSQGRGQKKATRR